jgi:hypothetical protein
MRVQTHAARQRLADIVPGRSGHNQKNRDQAQNGKGRELHRARHELDGIESAPIGAGCTRSHPIECSGAPADEDLSSRRCGHQNHLRVEGRRARVLFGIRAGTSLVAHRSLRILTGVWVAPAMGVTKRPISCGAD